MRIYGFEITDRPHDEEPAGWAEHCEEVWGEHRDFFLPSEKKIFRSRSAAQARVDLVKRWGGDAVLLEGTVQWETVEAANRRRKQERNQQRINALQARIDALKAETDGDAEDLVREEHQMSPSPYVGSGYPWPADDPWQVRAPWGA